MTLDHLRLFKDIAQTRSVSRGALLNGVSQSAASQHLQELESALGIRLVDRTSRPIAVTEAGRLYVEFCRDVLRLREKLDAALERLKGRVEGTVRVASIYSIGLSEMSRLEGEFRRRLPGAELRPAYLRPERVYEAVLNDQADVGLVSYPEPSKQIKVIPWREETMVVAVSPQHRLAIQATAKVTELQGENFIGFDDDLPIAREVGRFLSDNGVAVNLALHFDNIQSVKEAVALGSGVSILPEPVLRTDVEHGRLVTIALEAPGLVRPLGILHRRRKKFTPAAQAFLELLLEKPAERSGARLHPDYWSPSAAAHRAK